ncbi:MAG: hypothetical protein ABIQ02_05320 [Saprospiraceae bacterium]
MKKIIIIAITLASSFGLGFTFSNILSTKAKDNVEGKKVSGIGGIFFKCKDPKTIREWYKSNLGLNANQYGAVFEWRQGADTTKKGLTQWSPFKETTKYFEPFRMEEAYTMKGTTKLPVSFCTNCRCVQF